MGMDGWNISFLWGLCLFSGAMFISGRVVGSERTSLPVVSKDITSLIEVYNSSYYIGDDLWKNTASEVMKWLRHNRLFKILAFPRFCQSSFATNYPS